MNRPYTGGCACGAIRYEISGEPVAMNDCQCRQCQKDSGTGHGSYLTFVGAPAKIEGEARFWEISGENGLVKSRAFCPTCGTLVYLAFPAMPEVISVRAGSLDEPERYRPQFVTWAAAGHDWDRHDPALSKFDKMPPPASAG